MLVNKNLVDVFSQSVMKYRENIAIIDGKVAVTYEKLNKHTDEIALQLQKTIAAEDSIANVGIFLPRCLDHVYSVLASIKANLTYIPIDIEFPHKRIDYVLTLTKTKLIITNDEYIELLQPILDELPDIKLINLSAKFKNTQGKPSSEEKSNPIACILFTSGSTGWPKGVKLTQHGIINSVVDTNYINIQPDDVILHATHSCFDLSLFNIWGSLLNGATCVIGKHTCLTDINYLAEIIEQCKISIALFPTAAFHQLAQLCEDALANINTIIIAGEKANAKIIKEFFNGIEIKNHKCPQLINGYGPTENAVFSTFHTINHSSEIADEIPIGIAPNGVDVHLLGKDKCSVTHGQHGEIYLTGANLANGYIGASDEAERRFTEILIDGKQIRAYQTGDLAYYNEETQLVYIGRFDRRFKHNGKRINPAEIEQQLKSHHLIQQAVVLLNNSRLTAYIICTKNTLCSEAEIKNHLARTLTAHLIPDKFYFMTQYPLTERGKINYDRLSQTSYTEDTHYREENKHSPILLDLWRQVLHAPNATEYDDFFALGGDSIDALHIATLAKKKSILLNPADLVKYPTVKQLEKKCIPIKKEKKIHTENTLHNNADFPLLSVQRGIYTLCCASSIKDLYVNCVEFEIQGHCDKDSVLQTWKNIVSKYDFFRTALVFQEESHSYPNQKTLATIKVPFTYLDVSEKALAEKNEAIAKLKKQMLEPLQLKQNQILFHLGYIKLSATSCKLLWFHHHIMVDGWTIHQIISQFVNLYKTCKLIKTETPFQHIAERLSRINHDANTHFWKDYLTPLVNCAKPSLAISNREKSASSSSEYLSHKCAIPENTAARLIHLAKKSKVSLNTIFQSAWGILLCYYYNEKNICHGTVINLREHEDDTGITINTLPVHTQWEQKLSFSEWMSDYHQMLGDVWKNSNTSLQQILSQHNLSMDSDLFQTLFVFDNFATSNLSNNYFDITNLSIHEKNHYAISCIVNQQDHFNVELLYQSNFMSNTQITELTQRYLLILEQYTEIMQLGDIQFLLPHEAQQVQQLNHTELKFNNPPILHEVIQKTAEKFPMQTALRIENNTMTYQQLMFSCHNFSKKLQQQYGIGKNDIIAVKIERSFELVISLIAILQTGAAFLPLDHSWPETREKAILDSSNAKLLIENKLSVTALKSDCNVNTNDLELAYVMYTSGSTGMPKGVMVGHAAICNRIEWMQHQFSLSPGERVLHKTPITFDVSLWEIFWPLMFGGECVLAQPEQHRDMHYIQNLIQHAQIHYVYFIPSLLTIYLSILAGKQKTSLKYVFCSGEKLQSSTVEKFYENYDLPLVNLYGPTEAAIDCTCYVTSRFNSNYELSPPIGKPISNMQTYIYSKLGSLYPLNFIGNLHVAGIGIADGYINDFDRTKAVFSNRKILSQQCAVYNTGDLAYIDNFNNIHYIGRVDNQIKVNGIRIECEEIELQLMKLVEIQQAIVCFDNTRQKLVAFFKTNKSIDDIFISRIKRHLNKMLPINTHPTEFVAVDSMPLLSNGKIDRKALLANLKIHKESVTFSSRMSETLDQLHKIMSSICNKSYIDTNQNIIDFGITSLQLIEMVTKINQIFNKKLSLNEFSYLRTLSDIANHLDSGETIKSSCLIPLKPSGNRRPLVLIHPIGGTAFCFYPLISLINPEQPLWAFHDPSLIDPTIELQSIPDMASYYLRQLNNVFDEQEYILGGMSLGATIAVEIAHQLGHKYQLPLLLLDGWAKYPKAVSEDAYLDPYLSTYFKQLSDQLAEKNLVLPTHYKPIYRQRAHILDQYTIPPIYNPLVLFKAQINTPLLAKIDVADNYWGKYAKADLAVIHTSGTHDDMLLNQHNCAVFAKLLNKKLNEVEKHSVA